MQARFVPFYSCQNVEMRVQRTLKIIVIYSLGRTTHDCLMLTGLTSEFGPEDFVYSVGPV